MGTTFTRRHFLCASTAAGLSALCPSVARPGYPGNYRAGLPSSAGDAISELYDSREGLKYAAFTAHGDWVLLWGRNGWRSHGAPDSLNAKLHELNDAGYEIQKVVFSHDGGWLVLYETLPGIASWSSRGMSSALTDALHRLDGLGSTIKHVAFTRDGGWVILYGFNGFVSQGIPESARDKLRALRGEQSPLKHIAFTSDGGWVILWGRNGNSRSGCPQGAANKLSEFNNAYYDVHSIQFAPDDGYLILYNTPGNADTQYWVIGSDSVSNPAWHVHAHGFPDAYDEHAILRQSLGVLHARFMNWQVIRNSYQVSGRAYYIHDPYWEACNVVRHPTYGPRELLWYQMETLCLPPSAQEDEDEGPPMPEIHLYPYNKDSSEVGFARWANRVLVKYVGDRKVQRTGDFRVHLNTFHLGRRVGDHGDDPAYWACVMAHEMLHNLGHAHDVGDYGDNRQVNCFHRAVYFNGTYNGNRHAPQVICGCKPPI